MGKRGFTLVELLAVIVVLAIIVAIAVPSIMGINQSIKDNMLDKKITMIEEAAVLLGQDFKNRIISSEERYEIDSGRYPCVSYIIGNLVPDYLDKDNDNECLNEDSTETEGCIVDPSNQNNYLDKKEVIIYYKYKRIYAIVDIDDNLTCS